MALQCQESARLTDLVPGVGLERVGLQLVVGPEAEPVPVPGRLRRQELRRQVRREVVLPVRLHRGEVAAVPESGNYGQL